MILNPDMSSEDQAYQFFVQEALELVQLLEVDLLSLRQDPGIPKIHSLVRAAHSLKGGAASVGLSGIQTLAYCLENAFRAFYRQETEIDLELEDLLLQAYFCLRLPLLAQINTGKYDEAAALDKAKPVFTQLEARLGHTLESGADLPTAAELGVDVIESIFAIDVAGHLQHLEAVLANPEAGDVAEVLRTQAEVLASLGELFDLSGFEKIARTTLAALQVSHKAAPAIGKLALEDFRAGREAVLQGDRIQGGVLSPAWAEFAVRSQVDAPDPTAISLEDLCAQWQLVSEEEEVAPMTSDPPIPALSQEVPLEDLGKQRSEAQNLGQEVIPSILPATSELRLTTSQLFVCMVDGIAFITVPFNNIARILNPQAEQVKQVGKQRFLYWRERMIPVYRLSELLDYTHPLPKVTPAPGSSRVLTMLVFSQDNQTCALELKIDRLVSEPELVIKTFGAAIAPPRYLYGCTILEGGRLMPVIDGTALLNSFLDQSSTAFSAATLSDLPAAKPVVTSLPSTTAVSIKTAPSLTILVVDDSITVRKILDFTLRQAGYRVLQAEDGRKAIEKLQQNPTVQLVICDVEMPNMNGLEFLNHCRTDPLLAKIPTIMLTSRSSERDQQLATYLGAYAYFTKPYVEQEFLAVLKTILDKETPGVLPPFPLVG